MSENTIKTILIIIAIFCTLFTMVTLLTPDNDEVVYDEGYDNGYHEGYNEGYNYGFDEGCEIGEDIGYDEGYSDGIDYGWRDDNFEDVGEYFAYEASDYVRDRCDFHPLDEAIYIIDDYKNGDTSITEKEYDEAIRSVITFCEYFNAGLYQ